MNLLHIVLLYFAFSESFQEISSLNLLGVFLFQGKSNFFVLKTYMEELARKGHNVTVISFFPRKDPLNNYNDIYLSDQVKILEDSLVVERSYQKVLDINEIVVKSGIENCKILLSNQKVQNLWKSKIKFDLLIAEQFNTDCALGLAHILHAPVIGVTSNSLMSWHYNRFTVPYNPSFVPCQFLEGGTKPSIYQRVERMLFHGFFNFYYKFVGQRTDQNTLAEYFDDIPPLEKLAHKIKLVLLYTNNILFGSNLFPANVVEVGGYHVATPQPLPDDLQNFIDESKHGVIYVSFGSIIKASLTDDAILKVITSALSELPQRIIWKWESESPPGNLKDVYYSKWLPQNDIFAHPKVLAFYSHCGLVGTTEAVFHGVPIVGMPIFGDQPSNADAIEESGFGVQIQLSELTKDKLLKKFKTVLNPEFRQRVKALSKLWHDRPMSAMNTAVFWTEYAARNHNFTFAPAASRVPLYQYLCLDLICILFIVLFIIFYIFKSILSFVGHSKRNSINMNKGKIKSNRKNKHS